MPRQPALGGVALAILLLGPVRLDDELLRPLREYEQAIGGGW